MAQGISHRSHVSYIDKSREYYSAAGYDRPYRWAHYEDVPFSRLTKPLSRSRIGVVTTADQAPSGAPRNPSASAPMDRRILAPRHP